MEKLIGNTIKWKGRTYRVCRSRNPMMCNGCAFEKESLSECLKLKDESGLNCSGLVRDDKTSVHLIEVVDINKRKKK